MADKEKHEAKVRTEAGYMEVSIKEGFVDIHMPLEKSTRDSKSGQHRMIATTHGNVTTDMELDGEPVQFNINIFTPKK